MPIDNPQKPACGAEYEFLLASQKAIGTFSDHQLQSVAKLVRHDLRKYPQSGIYEDRRPRHLWDEYSLHVQYGPPQLDNAWEETIRPHITARLEALESSRLVLLTISAEWDEDGFETQDGGAINYDLLNRQVWLALDRLAHENSQDWNKG